MKPFDRPMRSVLPLAAVCTMVLTAACSNLDNPQPEERRYGSIVVEGKTVSETSVQATAKAIFFNSQTASVPSSITAQNDACTVTLLDTATVEIGGQNRAGNELTWQVGSTNQAMAWVPINFRYDSPENTPITYSPGATTTVTVPGEPGVYPGGSISVLLAEPLLAPPVTMGSTGPMVITWNASSSNTSAVLLSLQYTTTSGTQSRIEQIVCQLRDDGNVEIPASSLTTFRNSSLGSRQLTLTRFRTNELELDNRTLLHISSQVDTVVTLR